MSEIDDLLNIKVYIFSLTSFQFLLDLRQKNALIFVLKNCNKKRS
jgi:hypothetical protein